MEDLSDPEPVGRSRRREVHTEEITTKSSDGVTVTETHKTKTEVIENGDVISSEETVKESSKVEDDVPDIGDVELDPEPDQEDGQEEEDQEDGQEGDQEDEQQEDEDQEKEPEGAEGTDEPPQEEETENVPPYLQKNPENLTEQEIEEIDDLDFLETTVSKRCAECENNINNCVLRG